MISFAEVIQEAKAKAAAQEAHYEAIRAKRHAEAVEFGKEADLFMDRRKNRNARIKKGELPPNKPLSVWKEEVIALILKDPRIRRGHIMNRLKICETSLNTILAALRQDGRLSYNRGDRRWVVIEIEKGLSK